MGVEGKGKGGLQEGKVNFLSFWRPQNSPAKNDYPWYRPPSLETILNNK
jgi:hypothetical protein